MIPIFAKFEKSTGAIRTAVGATYNSDGDIEMMPDWEGPFEVPDDICDNPKYDLSCLRLKGGKLAIDDGAVAMLGDAKKKIRNEEKRAYYASQAVLLLQEIQVQQAAQQAEDPNVLIALAPLLPEWETKAYAVGDIVQYEDAPYRCVQAHNAAGNPGWNPNSAASLWAKYHARSAEYALPWSQPTGAHDAYQKDEYMVYGEAVYRCKTNNTVHAPDILPAAWEKR